MPDQPITLIYAVVTDGGQLLELTVSPDRAWTEAAHVGGLVAVMTLAADLRRAGNPPPAGATGGRGSGPHQTGPPAGGGQPDGTVPNPANT
jgi:hypothetical protein